MKSLFLDSGTQRSLSALAALALLAVTLWPVPVEAQTPPGATRAWVRLSVGGIPINVGDAPSDGPELGVDAFFVTDFTSDVFRTDAGQFIIDFVRFRKRVDGASPLLLNALISNSPVVAEFIFYGLDPVTGEEHYYTVTSLGDFPGYVAAIRGALGADGRFVEEVTLLFDRLMVEHEITGNVGLFISHPE